MARYDYGLRGWDQTVRPRQQAGGRGYLRQGGQGRGYDRSFVAGYDRDMSSGYGAANENQWRRQTPRVTARYNLDYVREQHPGERPVNYHAYGGGPEVPVGDMREYQRPYMTLGGTNTYRGGGRPVGWEGSHMRYDDPYRRRQRGYDRWF